MGPKNKRTRGTATSSLRKKRDLESMRVLVPLKEVLTPPQIHVLLFIWTNPGTTAAELHETIGISKSTLTRYISRLIHLGLVIEKRASVDTRRKLYMPELHSVL